jgi:hypothetical protein
LSVSHRPLQQREPRHCAWRLRSRHTGSKASAQHMLRGGSKRAMCVGGGVRTGRGGGAEGGRRVEEGTQTERQRKPTS